MKSNKIGKILTNYNDFNQMSHKMTFQDYTNDKYNEVHTELFNRALDRYIVENNIDKNEYKFIEFKSKNYYEPSVVCIKRLTYPYDTKKVSLEKYWDKYQFNNDNKEINNDFLEDKVNPEMLEIVNINYVTNKVTLLDKNTEKRYIKDISFINDKMSFNKDELSLENTFGYKINNKIYGK